MTTTTRSRCHKGNRVSGNGHNNSLFQKRKGKESLPSCPDHQEHGGVCSPPPLPYGYGHHFFPFGKRKRKGKVRAKPLKRTPFNLKRESTLRVGGSKLSILGPARTPKEVLKRPAATSLISKKQIGPVAKPRLCKKPAASLISKKQTRK